MKKSFKKAVAVLLAVLMVAFSVPFTALAGAAGDYSPNVEVQFGTFHADDATDWQDYTVAAGKTFDLCGLYDVPLEFNREAGTLTLSAAKAAKAAESAKPTSEPEVTVSAAEPVTTTSAAEPDITEPAATENAEPEPEKNEKTAEKTEHQNTETQES